MKKLFYLSILFLEMFSCQKEFDQTVVQENQDNAIDVQLRETPCGGDLFCTKVSNSPSRYIAGGGVGVVVNGQEYEFLPMELYDQSTGIVLKYNEQILVLHNGSNEYLSTKNSDIVLPRELGMLMNISFDDFGDRNGIASKIQTETGRPIQASKGYPIIDITGVGGNPDDGGPTVINVVECDYTFVSSVEEFKDEFFKEGGSNADKMLIEEAFNSCPEHDDGTLEGECNFCKDPRCLVDYLLGVDPNRLSDYSKELIVINYLRATFGLIEEQFDALSQGQENRNFAKILYDLASDCNNYDELDKAFGPPCNQFKSDDGSSQLIENNDFVDCISEEIVQEIITKHNISDQSQIDWIRSHPESWHAFLYSDRNPVGDQTVFSAVPNLSNPKSYSIQRFCPQLFAIYQNEFNPPNPPSVSAVIGGMNFEFIDQAGNSILVEYPWLYFYMDADCPNPAAAMSTAVINAYTIVQQQIAAGTALPNSTFGDCTTIHCVMLETMKTELNNNYNNCAGHNNKSGSTIYTIDGPSASDKDPLIDGTTVFTTIVSSNGVILGGC